MRLVAKTDIETPAADLFAVLTDVAWIEGLARRGGAVVERTGVGGGPVPGAGWHARFRYRGREREVRSIIERIDPPKSVRLGGRAGAYGFVIEPTLAPLSRTLTRLAVTIEVKPHSVGARIVLQTLRLGRGRLQTRLEHRLRVAAKLLRERATTS